MAINLAKKYADKVAERFAKASITDGAFSGDYSFTGVKTVTVYSVDTAELGDYTRSGTSRYGTPAELGDSIQELTLTQDKAFTYTIDKGNDSEQMNVKGAAKSLRREIDEVITPEMDRYRLRMWAENAGSIVETAEPTAESIVSEILDATEVMDNALVPESGRTLFISASEYKKLKQNPDFLNLERLGTAALSRGEVGRIDGMRVVKAPYGWLPDGVLWLAVHKNAVLAPAKLQDYKVHSDPPGINGNLVEGRLIHDAYVLGSKCMGVYAAVETGSVAAKPTLTPSGGSITVSGTDSGAVVYYTTDGTDPRYSASREVYSSAVTAEHMKAYAEVSGKFRSEVAEV